MVVVYGTSRAMYCFIVLFHIIIICGIFVKWKYLIYMGCVCVFVKILYICMCVFICLAQFTTICGFFWLITVITWCIFTNNNNYSCSTKNWLPHQDSQFFCLRPNCKWADDLRFGFRDLNGLFSQREDLANRTFPLQWS